MVDTRQEPREPVKVVGVVRKTAWERFVRLQRTTGLLARPRGLPRGVFTFRSHEEAQQWKNQMAESAH